jgi:HNH endonuclease
MPKPKKNGRGRPSKRSTGRSLRSGQFDVVHQSTAPPTPELTNSPLATNLVQVRPIVTVAVPEYLSDGRYPPSGPVGRVIIKHPGYEDHNDLIGFYAWDNSPGIHLGTVLLACGIVACNEFNGYLSQDKNGNARITEPDDYLLPVGDYFFHIGRDVLKYPVFPSFREWVFPHDNIPKNWVGQWSRNIAPQVLGETVNSTTSLAIIARDEKCCISTFQDGLERAHLCPQWEKDWFNSNDLQDYNSTMGLAGRSWIDDRANSIALRKDIHGLFDTGSFVFVRKRGNWVAHCLRVTNEFGPMYHNRVVSIHEGVSPHFLLARFAWAIFRFATRMFGTNELRLIRLRVPDKEGERHDIERPGYSIMDSIEKEKGGRSKKRKTEGEEEKTGGEKDSGVCSDDEATFVATETSESTILGSKLTPEYKRAKVPSLDLTLVNVITIPRRLSSFDRHIAEMKRRALPTQTEAR